MISQSTERQRRAAESFWNETTQALRRWARDQPLKDLILEDTGLRSVFQVAAARHIAGHSRSEAMGVAQSLAAKGLLVTIDFAGEHERSASRVEEVKNEILALVAALEPMKREAQMSLDLSQLGLSLDPVMALDNALEVVTVAQSMGVEVVLNMEEAALVDSTLRVHAGLVAQGVTVGVTLQAHLRRTRDDLARLMEQPGKIRLVKGAYAESDDSVLRRGAALDRAFLTYAFTLLEAGHSCAIATHDADILNHILEQLNHELLACPLEFEFLYGAEAAPVSLVRPIGFNARVFITYGPDWFLYVCHRLAEHPPALIQAIEDCFRFAKGELT